MTGASGQVQDARKTRPDVVVGCATARDLEDMADLLAELFALEADFRPDRAKQLAGLELILDTPALGRLFVTRADGRVVAMANALVTVSTAEGGRVLLLEDVIVGATHRRAGLGGGGGHDPRTLLADRDNAPALGFYRRLGFTGSNMTVLRKRTVA